MVQFRKEEKEKLGTKLSNLKTELSKLFEKYNFKYDGDGNDLVDNYYELFYYTKK